MTPTSFAYSTTSRSLRCGAPSATEELAIVAARISPSGASMSIRRIRRKCWRSSATAACRPYRGSVGGASVVSGARLRRPTSSTKERSSSSACGTSATRSADGSDIDRQSTGGRHPRPDHGGRAGTGGRREGLAGDARAELAVTDDGVIDDVRLETRAHCECVPAKRRQRRVRVVALKAGDRRLADSHAASDLGLGQAVLLAECDEALEPVSY